MPPLTTGSAYAVGGALVLGVVFALRSLGRREREAWANASLLVWWLTPVALLSFTHRGLYPWHAMTTLPAGHLLAARGIDWIWDQRRWLTPLLLIGGVFAAGMSFANLEVDHAFNAAYPIYKKDDPEAFDRLTLRSTLRIGEVTRQLADAYRIREAFTRLPEPDLAAWSQRPINTTRWFADPDLLIYQLELGLYDGVHQAGATFFPPNDTPRPFYTTRVVVEP